MDRERERSATNPSDIKSALESELLRTSGLYSKHLEAISTLDDEVKTILYQVIGVLSADDVMGQRLLHVIVSLNAMSVGIAEYMKAYNQHGSRDAFNTFRNRLLTRIYTTYTMIEEREIFHEVFGAPERQSSQVS